MLAKFGLIQLLGKFIPGLIGFLVAAVLTRLLAPEEYGTYSLATALAQLVAFAGFGWMGLSVTRLTTGRPADPSFLSAVLVIFATLTGTMVAGAAVLSLVPDAASHGGIILATVLGATVLAYFDLKSSFYSASFDFTAFLVLNLIRAVTSAAVSLAVAYCGGSGLMTFLASCCAVPVACLISRGKRLLRPAPAIDREMIRRICAFGLPIAGSMTLFAASAWTDRLVLKLYDGAAAVGLYAAAVVVIQTPLQMAAQAIGAAAYPLAVVAYEHGGRSASDRQLEQNLVALLGILLPGGIALCMLAPNLAEVLVGKAYRDAVIALTPFVAATAVISGIRGNFIDYSFQLAGKTWSYFGIAAVMAVVNVAALFLLVPRYGYRGAGAASLATAAAGIAYALIASRRVYRIPFPTREIAKVLSATLAMAMVLKLLEPFRGPVALGAQIGVGAGTYGAAVFALNLLKLRHVTMMVLTRWLAAR